MPEISVVIPVYNGAATIAQTLRSALGQSFTDIEVVVVDDGSTDATREVVAAFDDPRVRLIEGAHQGLAATRNRGVEAAAGELIAFLDADDLWTRDKLKTELARLRAQPDAALCYSWTCYISADNRIIGKQPPLHHEGDVYATMLMTNLLHCGSNALVRKSALEAIGGFRDDVENAEDWDCWLRLARDHRFVMVPRYQVLYRQRDPVAGLDLGHVERSNLRVLERELEWARSNGADGSYGTDGANGVELVRKRALGNLYRYFAVLHLLRRADAGRVWAALAWAWRAFWVSPSGSFRLLAAIAAEVVLPQGVRRWLLRGRRQRLEVDAQLQAAREVLERG